MEEGAWGKVIRNLASVIKMRPKQPIPFPRILPECVGPHVKRGLNYKLEATNNDGPIVQTLMAKNLSVHKFDLMTCAVIGKGIWGSTSEEVDLFIQCLSS